MEKGIEIDSKNKREWYTKVFIFFMLESAWGDKAAEQGRRKAVLKACRGAKIANSGEEK